MRVRLLIKQLLINRKWWCVICAAIVPFSFTNETRASDQQSVKEADQVQDEVQEVFNYELDNGLKLLVKPDHRAPVVVSQIWYRIGSSFELTGSTGVSHVLEHMMFKGTDRFGPGELSDLVARYGGSENAFTGRDYTGYYQSWEKSRLPLSFAIEANRMTKLSMDSKQFAKEVKVVMEERRQRTEDSPIGTAYERFNAAAFVSSPYQNPIIGWMHDLKRLTLDFTQQWYQQWYAPNNSTVVVVGDVNPEDVFELAKIHFGDIPAKSIPLLPLYDEMPPKGEKRIVVKEKVEVPQLMMGFLAPSIATAKDKEDVFALSMLLNLLDGGLSARFETHLVRGQEIASSIGSSYDPTARGDVLFTIAATPVKGKTLEQLEQAIFTEIEKILESPPSEAEMARTLAQIRAAEVFAQDSIFQQASMLGELSVIDQDWRLARDWDKYLSSVTPSQVQAVARHYLNRERLTIAEIVPESALKPALEPKQTQSKAQATTLEAL